MKTIDKRRANVNWELVQADGETYPAESYVLPQLAVLMDIRDELKKLNALLGCQNFIGIPTTLRSIRRAMPRRRVKKG